MGLTWVAVTLFLSACVPVRQLPVAANAPMPSPIAPPGGGTLTIALATEPSSLDPARGFSTADRFVLMGLFDTLVTMAPDGSIHPGLATAWESNADATEFTFTLRDGIPFHDGTLLDANAVKAALDHIQELTGFSAAQYGMRNFIAAEAVDDKTVRINFSTPKPRLLEDLSQPWMGIPAPAAATPEGSTRNPVGTGPFAFKAWVAGEQVTLTRNPDYAWAPEFAANPGAAYLDEVVFRVLPEGSSRLQALQRGAAQVVEDPPAEEAKALSDDGSFVLRAHPAPGMPSHMMLNVEKAPTDELAVRKAILYAVDQEALTQSAFAGLQSPAHSVLSPSTFGYDAGLAELYRFDLVKAESLLEEAGWVDNDADGIRDKNGANLRIVYPANPANEDPFMRMLAANLTDIGFEVELLPMAVADIDALARAGNHNMVNMGWISCDPGVLDLAYNSANIELGAAFSRFRSAELDEVLAKAAGELDPALQRNYYAQAQLIIMENALALPIHNYDRLMLMAPAVEGWRFDVEGFPYLNEVSLAE